MKKLLFLLLPYALLPPVAGIRYKNQQILPPVSTTIKSKALPCSRNRSELLH